MLEPEFFRGNDLVARVFGEGPRAVGYPARRCRVGSMVGAWVVLVYGLAGMRLRRTQGLSAQVARWAEDLPVPVDDPGPNARGSDWPGHGHHGIRARA